MSRLEPYEIALIPIIAIGLTLIIAIFALFVTGCSVTTTENPGSIDRPGIGINSMVEIGDGLYYDRTTGIAYWWNGYLNPSNNGTSPSPYYAPNGLPYRYNPETNTLEEIIN